jgi:hypothetical protein
MNSISRIAATAALSGAVAISSLALGAGTATAQGPSYQGGNCPPGLTCTHWCPGDPAIPGGQVLSWDANVCHDWYWGSDGIVDVSTNTLYPWSGTGPRQAAPVPSFAPPPPPAPLPPGTPFCSPRGSLIIIPPICDEIGVDMPPGSVAANRR